MPDRLATYLAKSPAALVAGIVLFSGVAVASPDWELVGLRAELTEISRELVENPSARALPIEEIMQGVEWEVRPARIEPAALSGDETPARLDWMDVRLALAPIHHVYGAKGAGPIYSALGDYGTEAILVDEGVATLGQLRDALTNRQWSYDLASDRHTLRVPLVIGENATLRLGDGDLLALSRADGAFLVNLGRLEVTGAEVSGTQEPSPRHERFRPFIASLGGTHIENARFADLGFGNSVKYSGLSLLSHPTFGHTARTVVHGARFDNMVTLSVVGLASPEIVGNKFFNMERNALLISRSAHASVIGNLFSGASPTNAVRILHGSDHAEVSGNVVLEGARAGFLVSSGSDDVVVRDNLIWRRNGGGVKLSGVRCGLVERNLILDDKQKGVEVRSSTHATVRANEIIGNRNAGVWVSAQRPRDVTHVYGNLIRENGSGVSTAQGGEIALEGNDLRNQFPRFLDGEVTHEFRAIAVDMTGRVPLVMSAEGTREARAATPETCGYAEK